MKLSQDLSPVCLSSLGELVTAMYDNFVSYRAKQLCPQPSKAASSEDHHSTENGDVLHSTPLWQSIPLDPEDEVELTMENEIDSSGQY